MTNINYGATSYKITSTANVATLGSTGSAAMTGTGTASITVTPTGTGNVTGSVIDTSVPTPSAPTESSTSLIDISKDLSVNQIIDLFTSGNMSIMEAIKGLRVKKDITFVVPNAKNSSRMCIEFIYQNKKYSIMCDKTAAMSASDDKTVATYSASYLKNVQKLSDEIINKYFDTAVLENNVIKEYALKPDCGYDNINDLKNAIFTEYKNNLILDNFLNNKNRTEDSATKMAQTSNGKTITIDNYTDYINEIDLATGEEADKLREESLKKFIKDFSCGNLAKSQVPVILDAIGIKYHQIKQTSRTSSGNYILTFSFNDKQYSITCNKALASKGSDDKNVKTYTAEEILTSEVPKELIEQYFDVVASENNEVLLYKIKDGKEEELQKTLSELKQAQFEEDFIKTDSYKYLYKYILGEELDLNDEEWNKLAQDLASALEHGVGEEALQKMMTELKDMCPKMILNNQVKDEEDKYGQIVENFTDGEISNEDKKAFLGVISKIVLYSEMKKPISLDLIKECDVYISCLMYNAEALNLQTAQINELKDVQMFLQEIKASQNNNKNLYSDLYNSIQNSNTIQSFMLTQNFIDQEQEDLGLWDTTLPQNIIDDSCNWEENNCSDITKQLLDDIYSLCRERYSDLDENIFNSIYTSAIKNLQVKDSFMDPTVCVQDLLCYFDDAVILYTTLQENQSLKAAGTDLNKFISTESFSKFVRTMQDVDDKTSFAYNVSCAIDVIKTEFSDDLNNLENLFSSSSFQAVVIDSYNWRNSAQTYWNNFQSFIKLSKSISKDTASAENNGLTPAPINCFEDLFKASNKAESLNKNNELESVNVSYLNLYLSSNQKSILSTLPQTLLLIDIDQKVTNSYQDMASDGLAISNTETVTKLLTGVLEQTSKDDLTFSFENFKTCFMNYCTKSGLSYANPEMVAEILFESIVIKLSGAENENEMASFLEENKDKSFEEVFATNMNDSQTEDTPSPRHRASTCGFFDDAKNWIKKHSNTITAIAQGVSLVGDVMSVVGTVMVATGVGAGVGAAFITVGKGLSFAADGVQMLTSCVTGDERGMAAATISLGMDILPCGKTCSKLLSKASLKGGSKLGIKSTTAQWGESILLKRIDKIGNGVTEEAMDKAIDKYFKRIVPSPKHSNWYRRIFNEADVVTDSAISTVSQIYGWSPYNIHYDELVKEWQGVSYSSQDKKQGSSVTGNGSSSDTSLYGCRTLDEKLEYAKTHGAKTFDLKNVSIMYFDGRVFENFQVKHIGKNEILIVGLLDGVETEAPQEIYNWYKNQGKIIIEIPGGHCIMQDVEILQNKVLDIHMQLIRDELMEILEKQGDIDPNTINALLNSFGSNEAYYTNLINLLNNGVKLETYPIKNLDGDTVGETLRFSFEAPPKPDTTIPDLDMMNKISQMRACEEDFGAAAEEAAELEFNYEVEKWRQEVENERDQSQEVIAAFQIAIKFLTTHLSE